MILGTLDDRDEGTAVLDMARTVMPAAPTPAPTKSRSSGARGMESEEIGEFLESHEWGVLATAGEAGPYAVPVSYGYDGRSIFLAVGPGRKLDNLLRDPALCLTIVDVRAPTSWKSVVVAGIATGLEGIGERAAALCTLRRRRPAGGTTREDLARLAKARLFRVEVREITGRRCG